MSDEQVVELLLRDGLITHDDLIAARQRVQQAQSLRAQHTTAAPTGTATETSLLQALVDMELVEPEDLARRSTPSRDRDQSSDDSSIERGADGQRLIRGYRLCGRIGRGGMGDVYLGINAAGDEVAIKLLPHRLAHDAEFLARFRREIMALSALNHAHITKFIAEGMFEGRPYLIMEAVRGTSLKERLTSAGALDEAQARAILQQMSEALAAAWEEAGLVHRDIKPANILLAVGEDPSLPCRATLCDFGLAKFRDHAIASEDLLTNTGVAVGTPHYMSPEQATGDRTADPRHDIYGLAATVYHALLGKTLYSGGSSAVIMYKQATATLDLRPLQRRGISAELVDVLSAMLAKPRDRRLSDWTQVQGRLASLPPLKDDVSTNRTAIVLGAQSRSQLQPVSVMHSSQPTSVQTAASAVGIGPRSHAGFTTAPGSSSRWRRDPDSRAFQIVVVAMLAVLCCLMIAGGVFLWLQLNTAHTTSLSAQPGQSPDQVLALTSQQQGAIYLPAGEWPGTWQLNGDHPVHQISGVNARESIIDGSIIVDVGTAEITLRKLRIVASDGPAIVVHSGSVIIEDCDIHSSTALTVGAGGSVRVERSLIRAAGTGLDVAAGGKLAAADSRLMAADAAIRARSAVVRLQRVVLAGQADSSAPSAALFASDGTISELRDVHIHDWQTGIKQDGGLLEIHQVWIDDIDTGIACDQAEAMVWEDVSITAREYGIHWSGRYKREWLWRELAVQAPHLSNVELPVALLPHPLPRPVHTWQEVPEIP